MSENNIQTDNTVNNQQHEEVDYTEPESPTLAIQQFASPTTGTAELLTDIVETDNTADTANTLLPGDAPTLASSNDKAQTTSLPSEPSKRGRRTSNDDEMMVYSLNHPPMKRRRLDLGDLMVKTTGPAKHISDKPVEQFRTVRRPKITRLAEGDLCHHLRQTKGQGSRGKDGRPTVSDLIQAQETEAASRDTEAASRKELAEERKRHEAFSWEE